MQNSCEKWKVKGRMEILEEAFQFNAFRNFPHFAEYTLYKVCERKENFNEEFLIYAKTVVAEIHPRESFVYCVSKYFLITFCNKLEKSINR